MLVESDVHIIVMIVVNDNGISCEKIMCRGNMLFKFSKIRKFILFKDGRKKNSSHSWGRKEYIFLINNLLPLFSHN